MDDYDYDFRPIEYQRVLDEISPQPRQPFYGIYHRDRALIDEYSNYLGYDPDNDLGCQPVEYEGSEIDLFNCQEDEHLGDVDITIKGTRRDDSGIFLRLRIADKEGQDLKT